MASLLSTEETAKRKKCSRITVVRAIKNGTLNGQQVGHYWVIFDDDALEKWEPDRTMQGVVARLKGHPSRMLEQVFREHSEPFIRDLAKDYEVQTSDITVHISQKLRVDLICSINGKQNIAVNVLFRQSVEAGSFAKNVYRDLEALRRDPELNHIDSFFAVIPGDRKPQQLSMFTPYDQHFPFDHRKVLREAVKCRNSNHNHALINCNANGDFENKDYGWIWSKRYRLYHPICDMNAPFPGRDQNIYFDSPINQCFRYVRSNPGQITGMYLDWAKKEGIERQMHDLLYRSDHIIKLKKVSKGRTMHVEVLWPR